MRDADQFRVAEFHAHPFFFAVVEQHFDAGGGEVRVEFFRHFLFARALLDIERDQRHLERGNGLRPDDAVVVVVLLNGGGDHPADADAVAAHGHHHGATVVVQHGGVERLGVLGAELEDVAHLDAALDGQSAVAVRARVTLDHVAQVGHVRQRRVALPVDVEVVLAVLVGAGGEVAHQRHAAVHHAGDRQVHRAQGAGPGAESGADLRLAGEFHRRGHCFQLLRLDVVELVIAAHQQRHQAAFAAFDDQRLDGLLDRQIKLLDQLLDGFRIRRVGERHIRAGGGALAGGRHGLGQLHVGGVAGLVGEGDVVLAGFGQHVEFMAGGAADGAGVRFHGTVIQAQPVEDRAVGVVHHLVGLRQRVHVGVEGVGVLHGEFAGAHDAEARPDLVAELGLNLIEVGRQLLVAVDLVAHQIGDHFLMGGAQAEGVVVAVGEAQQLGAVGGRPAGLFPQFHGLHHRHQHFLGAGAVHFLADNTLHLAQHAQTGWQPGVQAGGQLADHAGAQHELMADHHRVRGGLFNGAEQVLGGAHIGFCIVGG